MRYDERQAALARGALSLMQHLLKWCSCWREQSVLLQIEDSLAIYKVNVFPLFKAMSRLQMLWVLGSFICSLCVCIASVSSSYT